MKLESVNLKGILAVSGMAGCLLIVAAIINVKIPAENRDILNILSALFFRETLGPVMRSYFPVKDKDIKKEP